MITLLIIYLKLFEVLPESLFKLIKLFKYITNELTVLNKLENLGLIPIIINLLKKVIDHQFGEDIGTEETTLNLLKILVFLSNLSAARQEQLALQ